MTCVYRRLSAVLIALAALSGCASNDAFSQLTGHRFVKSELNTYDVIIISVDGKHYIERRERVTIEPGTRDIVVQGPAANGFTYGEQRTINLDVKPCTLYWLEAKKLNALEQNFEPRVNYSEPIAGCSASK